MDAHVRAVANDWETADLSLEDQALCSFAWQLTDQPQAMSSDHVANLRDNGFGDIAIHDAVQVVGYFNYINRVADALDVDMEDFVVEWEKPAN